MDYTEVDCKINPAGENIEILVAYLADIGYSMFESSEDGVKAYIVTPDFSQQQLDTIPELFEHSSAQLKFKVSQVPDINWNEEWESNFKPVRIDDTVYVRAEYHPADPDVRYELVIHPRMAFGTGHHATTTLMIKAMLKMNFAHQSVLDMGCGTGILAILATKMGAGFTLAVDNDPNAVENALHNCLINNTTEIEVLPGDATTPGDRKFDVILANINRNIIIEDLALYIQNLSQDGKLVTSGYYLEDLEPIRRKAEEFGLKMEDHESQDNWCRASFIHSFIHSLNK